MAAQKRTKRIDLKRRLGRGKVVTLDREILSVKGKGTVVLKSQGVVSVGNSIFKRLVAAQQGMLKQQSDTQRSQTGSILFQENGLEFSIDDHGFMTAQNTDLASRMANKSTAEKAEALDATLQRIHKKPAL